MDAIHSYSMIGTALDNVEVFYDCNGDCTIGGFLYLLGSGSCDYIFPVFNCDELNCDNGDCGSWNGTVCMAESAIKYILAA